MRDFYAFDVIQRKNSRFNGLPYYQIDCVGVDPQTRHLEQYHTYAVPGFENFDQWLPIIHSAGGGKIAWFRGNIRFKANKPDQINADSVPQLEDVVGLDRFEQFIRYQMAHSYITNGDKPKEFSEVGKQFFLEG